MSLKCELSGQEPEHPVISRNGHVFERRLIVKHLEAEGTCPLTKEPMSVNDLIEIKVEQLVRPRPAKATSIPSMLNLFQNEWDAVMLECFALKEQLNTVRQELADALYRQDAACRVIARLTKERDEARRQLATAQAQLATVQTQGEDAMEVENKGIGEQVKQKLIAHSQKLAAERKKRVVPKETATVEDIKSYKAVADFSVHSASKPGILCLDIHPDQKMVLTGGVDKNVVLFNKDEGKVVATMTGHTKKVSDVLFHPQHELFFSASHDKTVRIWSPSSAGSTKFSSAHSLRLHEGEVSGVTLQPLGEHLVSASTDSSWAFIDIQTARALAHVRSDEPEGFECVQFHPDGVILGTGTLASRIRVWDVKTLSNVASFEGHKGKITDISFSENGFFMASAGEDSVVKLWDLRKLKVFQTLDLEGVHSTSLSFDYSGSYLAVGGHDGTLRVYGFNTDKQLHHITTLNDHTKEVTDVQFGKHAAFLASASADRTLRFFAFE